MYSQHQLELLYNAIRVPMCILQGEDMILCYPESTVTEYPAKLLRKIRQDFHAQHPSPDQAGILWIESIAQVGIVEWEPDTLFLFGPVSAQSYRAQEILSALQDPLYDGVRVELANLIYTTPVLSGYSFLAQFRLALSLLDRPVPTTAELYETLPSSPPQAPIGRSLFYAQEELNYHTPFALEERLTKAIEDGDLSLLQQTEDKPTQGNLGILSTDPLRQAQYMFVTAAAVASRAAIRGGLDPEISYSTADLYCQEMDRLAAVAPIEALMVRMSRDFCDKVASVKSYLQYSPAIRSCCRYIHRNSHHRITLEELSRICGLSPSRLSESFHKETGYTIVEYIHEVRLVEGEYLLTRSLYPIGEIAVILGYSSQSYFTERFRRRYGMTPAQYRRKSRFL